MELVETERADGIVTVRLNEPGRRNAFSLASVAELVHAVERAEADPACGALVITGAPPAFCGGADLQALENADESGLRAIYAGFLRVARCTLPTIAAVNGAAVGAGMNLALACDVRLVAESGWFDTRFLRLGVHPGGGHSWLLRELVGPQQAAALLLFGERVAGADAVTAGLALRCVPDDQLMDAAHALAAGATRADRDLVAKAKATLRGMADVTNLDHAVACELEPQLWSLRQPAFTQGLGAARAGIASRR
jgi:enoyl-CoA hydratase